MLPVSKYGTNVLGMIQVLCAEAAKRSADWRSEGDAWSPRLPEVRAGRAAGTQEGRKQRKNEMAQVTPAKPLSIY